MITVDSNVYISAVLFRGAPWQLLHLAIDGAIEIAISPTILNEVLRVLREKFERSEGDLAKVETLIRSPLHDTTLTLAVIQRDPDDNRVLECAIAAGSEAIVTGDRDLLELGVYQRIRILTVREFLDSMRLVTRY